MGPGPQFAIESRNYYQVFTQTVRFFNVDIVPPTLLSVMHPRLLSSPLMISCFKPAPNKWNSTCLHDVHKHVLFLDMTIILLGIKDDVT